MNAGIFVLNVRDGGEETRIVVGCEEAAAATLQQLRDLGYQVWPSVTNEAPKRSENERKRAELLLYQLQG